MLGIWLVHEKVEGLHRFQSTEKFHLLPSVLHELCCCALGDLNLQSRVLLVSRMKTVNLDPAYFRRGETERRDANPHGMRPDLMEMTCEYLIGRLYGTISTTQSSH